MVRRFRRDGRGRIGLECRDLAVRYRNAIALERVGYLALTLFLGKNRFDIRRSVRFERDIRDRQRAVVDLGRFGFAARHRKRTARENEYRRDKIPKFLFHHNLLEKY